MKKILFVFILPLLSVSVFAQYEFDVSPSSPFGKLNPGAYPQTADYAPLIGISECKSQNRAPDGSWNNEVDMIWRWKYIMNGMGVQDETLKSDGSHSGSIRQFNADSTKWYVHYYSSPTPTSSLSTWEGNKTDEGKIVHYRRQKAPNGTDGYYRLTFYDITDKSYNWIGEWVNLGETFSYPTWKISCTKKES
ncbi:MAG: hypothetical protein ABJR05_02780 [Balneola sp.]